MHGFRRVVLWSVLAGGAVGCPSVHHSRTALIEWWVDAKTVAAVLPEAPWPSRFLQADGIESFVADYPFERRRPDEHCLLSVSIAPAGGFLEPARHEARRAALQREGGALDHAFPAIGLRAQREFFGMGPGGAAHGLTFTTRDGRYDVRIVVSELLPDSVTAPELDLEDFARRLAARYDAR